MKNPAEGKVAGTGELLRMDGEEYRLPVRRRRRRLMGLFTIAGSIVVVGAIAVAAAQMSSEPGARAEPSAASSVNQYYTSGAVIAACDELIGANDEPASETPDVTVCVGRGSDDQRIEGISVGIAPKAYSSLSPDERAAIARAFSDRVGMPVWLKAREAPDPT